MNDEAANIETALVRSQVFLNCQVWRVRLNVQHRFERASEDDLYSPENLDELCLDFNKPLRVPVGVRKHYRVGSLWVNISNCGLRLQHKRNVLVRSGDSPKHILAVFPRMLDLRLVSVQIDTPGGDTRFEFDEQHTLFCFPANSTGGASWIVVTEGGNEFRFRPGAPSALTV